MFLVRSQNESEQANENSEQFISWEGWRGLVSFNISEI